MQLFDEQPTEINSMVHSVRSSSRGASALITDAIVIAFATAFAYFATFIYELGYCYHFNIPPSLINPNISTILFAGCALCFVLVTTSVYLGLAAPLFNAAFDSTRSYRSVYWFLGLAFVGLVLIGKIYDFGLRGLLWYLAGMLGVGFIFFGPALLFNRKTPLRERIDQQAALNRNDPLHFDRILELWLHPKVVNYYYVLVLFLGFSWMLGNGNASTQTRFLTLRDAPTSVVLRNYGEVLIVGKFSRQTRIVGGELSLLWLGEKKQIDFNNEIVGPLVVSPELSQTEKDKTKVKAETEAALAAAVAAMAMPASTKNADSWEEDAQAIAAAAASAPISRSLKTSP